MRIVLFAFCGWLIVAQGCWQSADSSLSERLIRFTDDTLTVGSANGAEVLLIYKSTDGVVLDSSKKWISKEYFNFQPSFIDRFCQIKRGERFEWKLPENWKDPHFLSSMEPAFLEIEVLEIWSKQKWMNALTSMAQNEQFSEDTIVQWIGEDGLNMEHWDVKKSGLLWRWLGDRSGVSLDSLQPLTTYIGTFLLDDTPVGKTIVVTALTSHQQQWIPAVQWVLPYAQDGDSIEIVSKSDWTFEHPENMGIAPHTPLKFRVGVHKARSSDVKLQP